MDYYRVTRKGWDFSRVTTASQIADWYEFYQELFGMELSEVTIPGRGADGLVMVAEGLCFGQAYEACRKLFPCIATQTVDQIETTQNLRSSRNGSYALWVGSQVSLEPQKWDPRNPDAVLGTTLLEDLLYRMMYYCKTGKQVEDGVDCLTTRIAQPWPKFSCVLRIGWETNSLAIRWRGLSKKKDYSYRPVYL